MQNDQSNPEWIQRRIQKLVEHDVEEGIIIFDTKTNKYEFNQNWDLFGYTVEELFEGLEDIL